MEESQGESMADRKAELMQALKVFGLRFIQMVDKDKRQDMLGFIDTLGMTTLQCLDDEMQISLEKILMEHLREAYR